MKQTIKIGMAEDHVVLRQGIISLLRDQENISILFDVGNGKELLENLKISKPDVILLDIDMPIMDGSQALQQISILYPEIKVIMLSMHYDEGYIAEFTSKGARAYLPKGSSIEKILEVIESVYYKGYFYDEDSQISSESLSNGNNHHKILENQYSLTQREFEIIRLLQRNKTTAEIADALNISLRTVEGHRTSMMNKTKSNNLAALIASVFGTDLN